MRHIRNLILKSYGGPDGETHDVGIFWPPGRPPVLVAAPGRRDGP